MLPYIFKLGLICINFTVVIYANVQVHVKSGCAIVNEEPRCTATGDGLFGVFDWIGLKDNVFVTPDKKGSYWCDNCYNSITIYTDFPYTPGSEPPQWAKPRCKLSLKILDGGDIYDLFLEYFPSQQTMCLGYDQAPDGDERPIVGGPQIGCCRTRNLYTGAQKFLNPYFKYYAPYDRQGTPRLCYDCPSSTQYKGPKPEQIWSPVVTPNPRGSSNDPDENGIIEIEADPADKQSKQEKFIPKSTKKSGDEQQAANLIMGADAGGSNDPLIFRLDDSTPTPSDGGLPTNAGDMYQSQPSTNFNLDDTAALPSFDFSL